MHIVYIIGSWCRNWPLLQSLPFWGLWLLALIAIWVLLIIYVSIPWWMWGLLGLITVLFLFNSLLHGIPGPQG